MLSYTSLAFRHDQTPQRAEPETDQQGEEPTDILAPEALPEVKEVAHRNHRGASIDRLEEA